jgi:hypothetical protein
MTEYYEQLAKEFNLTQKQIEMITTAPFRVITESIRKDERKGFLLNNFCRLVPKFAYKPNRDEMGKDNGDIQSIQDLDITHTRGGSDSTGKIEDLSEVPKTQSDNASM